ncbi:hypothetical protein F7734_03675 [Scytonema sp. UIC 10036]|uniref:hypothetical protein n=1 Tax=Scytonema sp. UIC 10036 TaxID=2304196 RepID=UPI0012DAB426|nr:hypothetical protein [Scytonema sp. UIC 10036]MUG91630.1 hypothetical protein [Scytonema sp. UIC 10036]
MKLPKAIGVTLLAVIWGTQNPAEALVNNQAIQSNITLTPTKLPTTKQSNLVAINDTYWGPQRDFEIQMPGRVESNERNELTSWSTASQIAYIIAHKDMPSEVFYLSTLGIQQLLQSSMRENIARKGKVVRSTNLVIDGYPGLELLVQNSDGSLGQYQAFLVKGRMYVLGAVTQNELTTEVVNFFKSFRIYPEKIRFYR